MLSPSLITVRDAMRESRWNEEYIFDLGISNRIIFMVIVPEIGACRVPAAPLSHFQAGADEYEVDGMEAYYSSARSGKWLVKRDRLRIVEDSWHAYRQEEHEIGESFNKANHSNDKGAESPQYFAQQYPRLIPKSQFTGGRITTTDYLTLDDAANMATKHAKTEVTKRDFLRAASRGEIFLKAVIRRKAKLQKIGGGIYSTSEKDGENIISVGRICTLPQEACTQLANVGRANWRKFDSFRHKGEIESDVWQWLDHGQDNARYVVAELTDDEPDFETVLDDCLVSGEAVHALADAFLDEPDEERENAKSEPKNALTDDKPKEITTSQALTAFEHLVGTFKLRPALANKPDWILVANVQKGSRGKKNGLEGTWNPVILAIALMDKKYAQKPKLTNAFHTHNFLSNWRDEWIEKSNY